MIDTLPSANIRSKQQRSLSLAWIVPVVAIIVTLGLFIRWNLSQGPQITITFHHANGLTSESPILYRGIIVGRIEDLSLNSDATKVIVRVRLKPFALSLAKEHTKWWVVRPSVSLQGVQGLDTILGPRYIRVLPGSGMPTFSFTGSSSPVPMHGKLFTLISNSADSVTLGTPLFYRGIEIGEISKIKLSNDASTVRLQCIVQQKYAPIIRTNTKFWNISGIKIDADFLGIDFKAGPLTSWIKGGISLATPTRLGDLAPDGYAFTLDSDSKDSWLEWSPVIDLSHGLQPE